LDSTIIRRRKHRIRFFGFFKQNLVLIRNRLIPFGVLI
jgi:hypothetical protein